MINSYTYINVWYIVVYIYIYKPTYNHFFPMCVSVHPLEEFKYAKNGNKNFPKILPESPELRPILAGIPARAALHCSIDRCREKRFRRIDGIRSTPVVVVPMRIWSVTNLRRIWGYQRFNEASFDMSSIYIYMSFFCFISPVSGGMTPMTLHFSARTSWITQRESGNHHHPGSWVLR